MRTLITVLSVFLLLCIAMTVNFRYINKTADELTELANSLSVDDGDCLEKIDEIKKRWEKSSTIFSLSVGFKEIDYLKEALISLESSAEYGDKLEFERYRVLLIDAIDGVRRLERFSVMNIL